MMKLLATITVLVFLSATVDGQDGSIGCYVEGECINSAIVDIVHDVPTPEACSEQCTDGNGCSFFTHHMVLYCTKFTFREVSWCQICKLCLCARPHMSYYSVLNLHSATKNATSTLNAPSWTVPARTAYRAMPAVPVWSPDSASVPSSVRKPHRMSTDVGTCARPQTPASGSASTPTKISAPCSWTASWTIPGQSSFLAKRTVGLKNRKVSSSTIWCRQPQLSSGLENLT